MQQPGSPTGTNSDEIAQRFAGFFFRVLATEPEKVSHSRAASVRIQHPNYVGRIDVTVTANNANQARQLMKAQYGVEDWHIGSIRQVK